MYELMKEQRGAKIMVLVKPVLLIPGKHSFLFSFSFFLYQESIKTLFARWRDISLRPAQISYCMAIFWPYALYEQYENMTPQLTWVALRKICYYVFAGSYEMSGTDNC